MHQIFKGVNPPWNIVALTAGHFLFYPGWSPDARYSENFLQEAHLLHWNGPFKPWNYPAVHSDLWEKWFIPDPSKRFSLVRPDRDGWSPWRWPCVRSWDDEQHNKSRTHRVGGRYKKKVHWILILTNVLACKACLTLSFRRPAVHAKYTKMWLVCYCAKKVNVFFCWLSGQIICVKPPQLKLHIPTPDRPHSQQPCDV